MGKAILAIMGVTFVASAIWLAVRIFNRREKWAKRAAVALVVLFACYPLSIGPVCWIKTRHPTFYVGDANFWDEVNSFYSPILRVWCNAPDAIQGPIDWYVNLGAAVRINVWRSPDRYCLMVWTPELIDSLKGGRP